MAAVSTVLTQMSGISASFSSTNPSFKRRKKPYPNAFCAGPCKRCPLPLLDSFRLRNWHGLFTEWPYVQIGVLPPIRTAVIAENVSWKTFRCLPPCAGFSCSASTTAGRLRRLSNDRTLVIAEAHMQATATLGLTLVLAIDWFRRGA